MKKKRGEEKKKRKKKKKKKRKGMKLVKFCMESLVSFLGMDCYGFLWILGFLI